MNSKQRIGLAIGGGVIAVAAAVGVGAMAANLAGGGNAAQVSGYQEGGPGGRDGGGQAGGGFDTTTMAKQLAAKLGVDEAKMKTALDNAMTASRPAGQSSANAGAPGGGATPGAAPSGAPGGAPSAGGQNDTRRTEMLTAVAQSVATELNLDQAKVLAALQEVWQTGSGAGGAQPTAQATK
jgi:hypothetical protein